MHAVKLTLMKFRFSFSIAVFDKKDGPLTEEESEQYHVAKEKMLGNIKFIGLSIYHNCLLFIPLGSCQRAFTELLVL